MMERLQMDLDNDICDIEVVKKDVWQESDVLTSSWALIGHDWMLRVESLKDNDMKENADKKEWTWINMLM